MAIKFDSFEDVRQYLSDIPAINQGGCGIAALAMARWLRGNSENWRRIMFFMGYNDTNDFMNNTQSVYNNQTKRKQTPVPVAPSHAGVVFEVSEQEGVQVIDTGGRLDLLRYVYTHTFNDEGIMVQSVNNVGTWNTAFNRKYVKKIAKDLNVNMSDIDLRTKAQFRANEPQIFYKPRKKY